MNAHQNARTTPLGRATLVEFCQGFRSMAAPTRELEKLIVSGKLAQAATL